MNSRRDFLAGLGVAVLAPHALPAVLPPAVAFAPPESGQYVVGVASNPLLPGSAGALLLKTWLSVAPDGTGCNDGLFCNGADSCAAGACTGHAGFPCGGDDCDEAGDRCIACGGFGEPCCGGDGCDVPGGGCCSCFGGVCLHCGTHSDCPGPFCPGGGDRWECEGGRCVFGPCG